MQRPSNIHVPREDRIHGEASFPIGLYHYSALPGEPVVDCHWHNEAEFLVVTEGQTMFQIGTDYFSLQSGDAVFIHGGDIHAGHPLGDGGCSFFAIVFDMTWLSGGLHDRLHSEYIVPLLEGRRSLPLCYTWEQDWSATIIQSLHEMNRDIESLRPGYELSAKSRLYNILATIAASHLWVERQHSATVEHDKLELLKEVLTYIEQHYRSKIYLKQLADMTLMEESQFCRFFKKYVHKTPIAYINSYRIKQASELLRTDRKLLDIALDVGFDNPSYFIKRFRNELHCTPAEYRKKLSERN